jgi:hypothetical protein
MSINNTTLLGLAQPVTGQESGIWGDDVNNGFTILVDISVAGTNNITYDGDVTLSVSNGNNSSSFTSTTTTTTSTAIAQYAILNLSGSRAAARNIIVPTTSKTYLVINSTSVTYTIKKFGGTGVNVLAGESALVFYNTVSADVAKITSTSTFGAITFTTAVGSVSATVPIVYGGTSASSTLTLQSTSGVGTTDAINLNVGNAGAVNAINIATTGIVTFNTTGAITLPTGGTFSGSPVVGMLRYNSATSQFEGYSGATPAWASVGGAAISNDASTASTFYPLYAKATSGTALTVYTANTEYTFNPGSGDLTSKQFIAGNGLHLNNQTIGTSYSIPTGYSAMSTGPITLSSGVSVTLGASSKWAIL